MPAKQNDTMRLLLGHRSDREFSERPIPEDVLNAIVEAAHVGPTSVNGQQISLVVVRNPETKARIAEISGGQSWIIKAPVFIVVVIDFHKTEAGVRHAGKTQRIHECVEGFTIGALDAGITLATLITAAHAQGLGVVPIGGIRNDPEAMIDLLKLPPLTFPIVGLCVGQVAQLTMQKPRLALNTFRHDEVYRQQDLDQSVADYDARLKAHWLRVGRPNSLIWSENTANYYQRNHHPETRIAAIKQGFKFDS